LKAVDTIDGIVPTEICHDKELLATLASKKHKLVLKHKKIEYISYPHEWCASMLKDAALFHLELSQKLLVQELFLKDAHPWNILFEKGRPVFVDFTSIVSRDSLFGEVYLEANQSRKNDSNEVRLAWIFKEIFERMYIPYFAQALCGYAFGQHSRVRKAIEATTLNTSTSVISLRNCFPGWQGMRQLPLVIAKLFGLLRVRMQIKNVINRLIEKKDATIFSAEIYALVSNLNVEIANSAYSNYYELKGENNAWVYSKSWSNKQKSVYGALNKPEIESVLDVACNTGWFAILADILGKRVVAFDIDEGCIEVLYAKVKKDQLNILPLVLNFTEMTQDRFSIVDGKKVLINATQRLCSDSVIALGIIHHLILGVGLSFNEILDKLIPLCRKQLVIEFIDSDDEMIQSEPSFFPAYFNNRELLNGYDIKILIALIESRGFEVFCEKSHPSTRSILVCNVKHL
jgi:2-polyprenyl-3-methyl-5-hydroxy-6-metoxy-1,4-benzoquinol methylase